MRPSLDHGLNSRKRRGGGRTDETIRSWPLAGERAEMEE